ncbi:MAG: AAA family ATPase [Methermicoccaceae archaeon]
MSERGEQLSVDVELVQRVAHSILSEIRSVVVGKEDTLELMLIGLLAEGNILMEGAPGVAKTTIAKLFAHATGCEFKRIQFTPDLQPSDITGVYVYDQKTQEFRYYASPIFANIVLADEINRAAPKTQSAMLEAMEEKTITVEGEVRELPRPFMLIATENPIELEGTYSLPEAQIDRFTFKLRLSYPDEDEELGVLRLKNEHLSNGTQAKMCRRVSHPEELLQCIRLVKSVHIEESVMGYIRDIVMATRTHEDVFLGASPRGSINLLSCAKARAAMLGRSYVIPDDVKYLAPHILNHRIILSSEAELAKVGVEDVIQDVLATVSVPWS